MLRTVAENGFILAAIVALLSILWVAAPKWISRWFTVVDPSHDKRTRKIRESFSQYLAGVAVVIGVLVSLDQTSKSGENFQRDFRQRLHHDKRSELLALSGMLASENEAVRVSGVYAIAELLQPDSNDLDGSREIADAVLNTLVAFIRLRQGLDVPPQQSAPSRIPIDAQAAISVIGKSQLAGCDEKQRSIKFDHLALIGADFREGHFDCARFMGSKLAAANFSGAFVNGADFTAADLGYQGTPELCTYGDKLDVNDLWNPHNRSERASLQTNFVKVTANGAKFYSANLSGVRFENSVLHGAKFDDADLGAAEFVDNQFEAGELSQACVSAPLGPSNMGVSLKDCAQRVATVVCDRAGEARTDVHVEARDGEIVLGRTQVCLLERPEQKTPLGSTVFARLKRVPEIRGQDQGALHIFQWRLP